MALTTNKSNLKDRFGGLHQRASSVSRNCLQENVSQLTNYSHKAIKAEVTNASDTNFFSGFYSQGIYVETWDTQPIGTLIRVEIYIIEIDENFELDGRVCLIKTEDGIEDDLSAGMGIEFLGLTEMQRQAIATFGEIREPIFYDYDQAKN